MFGLGRRSGGGGKEKQPRNEEDDLLRSMMVDPAVLMKGIEEDPSLLAELEALSGGGGGGGGVQDQMGMTAPLQSASEVNPLRVPAVKKSAIMPAAVPIKAPGKPEGAGAAADAFLMTLGSGGVSFGVDGDVVLGMLVDESAMMLETRDLQDEELLAELGGLGWTEQHEEAHNKQLQGQQASTRALQEQAQLQQQGAPVAPEAAAAAEGGGEGTEEEQEDEGGGKGNEGEMALLAAAIAESRQKAVALKKEGKMAEAVAEVKRLKALEKELGVRGNLQEAAGIARSLSHKGPRSYEEEEEQEEEQGEGEGEGALSSPSVAAASTSGAGGGGGEENSGSSLVGSSTQRVAQLSAEIQKKRQQAAAHHKAGHTEEAMSFLREVKSLEQEVQRLQRRASSRSLLQLRRQSSSSEQDGKAPAKEDAFTSLEEALNEAKQRAVSEAKRLKPLDPQAALEAFKQSKEWEAKLVELQERRTIPEAAPAPFRWTTRTRTYKKALEDVPMDKLELAVHEGSGVLGVRREKDGDNNGGKEAVLVQYDLGFPKDGPHAGRTPSVTTKGQGAIAQWDFKTQVELARGSKSTEQAFARRHATFQCINRRKKALGLITNEEVTAQCQVDLSPLLDHCEMSHLKLPLCRPGQRRPAGGGHLTVSLRLRQPLKTSEMATEETKTLLVGPWPEITTAGAASAANPSAAAAPKTPRLPPASPSPAGGSGTASTAMDARFAELTGLERSDPLNAALLISNDVLEHELSLLKTQNPDKLDENDLAIREAELNMKLNLLVLRVQREEISMEQYVGMLTERIKRDQLVALYCSKVLGQRALALRVMKRIKIMEEELASAAGVDEEA